MRRVIVTVLASLCVTAPVSAANLIVNGGFEADQPADGGYIVYSGGQTFTGWTVTGVDAGSINTNYTEPQQAFHASEGLVSFDITGLGNTGPTDGIFQDIATTAGQRYSLKFDLGNATGAPQYASSSLVGVSLNGGPTAVFTNSMTTAGDVNWAAQTLHFTAAGATTRIAFTNATPSNDNFAGLDRISVQAVPETATWAMMVIGFGTVGGAMRGRRKVDVRFG